MHVTVLEKIQLPHTQQENTILTITIIVPINQQFVYVSVHTDTYANCCLANEYSCCNVS